MPYCDGSLMANLCYRVGALYTGLDQVLGASARLKHFGTRRLGRMWDNVSTSMSPIRSIHPKAFIPLRSNRRSRWS